MGLVSEPPAGEGRGQGSGCAAGPELQGRGDLMWAFLGKGLLQTEGTSGVEAWRSECGQRLGQVVERSWKGSWGQAGEVVGARPQRALVSILDPEVV